MITTGIVILTVAAGLVSGQKIHRDLPKFPGAEVTVIEPPTDKDGFVPEGTATVCVDLKPQKQCYTPPKQYCLRPAVSLVQVDKDTPAILFESHYEPHRFIISSYLRLPSTMIDSLAYHLEDQYMTVRHYDLDSNADVLAAEKPEILARLRKVKAVDRKR